MRRNKPSPTDAELTAQAHRLLEGLQPAQAPAVATIEQPPPAVRSVPEFPYGLPEIPAGQRRVIGACGICGQTGSHDRKRLGVPGREFGLPTIKGPTDRVAIELCRDCESRFDDGGDFYYEGPGLPANVGYAATRRLRDPRRGRAEFLDWLPEREVIPLERLVEFTWAGQVITARVEGRPDPETPPFPFAWLDNGTINSMKQRKKERTA